MAQENVERFKFTWAPSYGPAAAVFGIRPDNVWAEISETELNVRFGLWSLSTPLSNIADVAVTGPYRWWKTAGAARLGVTDRGLTFATNGDRGVLLTFVRPVRGRGPYLAVRHPELTVTVTEVDRFVDIIGSRRTRP
jgi:hypothetical protein